VFLSSITEPAAMTIAAILLTRQFYDLQPSVRLKYATLGVLFVNVSIGGTLTHFAAPPILANVRNPAGQALLGKFFDDAVNPLYLFLGAAIPTLVAAAAFRLL
jgi:hypothetical protein